MRFQPFSFLLVLIVASSCHDDAGQPGVPASTTKISGQAIIKVLPASGGWVMLKETLQPQYMITRPKREISWTNSNFNESFRFRPDTVWWLNDIAVHPSGDVSAVSTRLDFTGGSEVYTIRVKVMRFGTDGSVVEEELTPAELRSSELLLFPGSLDRAKVVAHGEDAYVIARWRFNDVHVHRISITNDELNVKWKKLIEPESYIGTVGIIGGGFDNFRQGDRHYFIHADVDGDGNLYVGVPGTEELLVNHDHHFGDNLMADADPGSYDFGMAILTKLSPSGERMFSKLQGKGVQKRMIGMRVLDDGVYLVGRVKTGTQANSWDALVLKSDVFTGAQEYESTIDVRDGDMFWDVDRLDDGSVVAVGTSDYVQNPQGLSVSDARKAVAVVLDGQGKITREIELPQGPAERGSEAMFVKVLGDGNMVVGGVHNAPGTHAAVYCDGFIAIRYFRE